LLRFFASSSNNVFELHLLQFISIFGGIISSNQQKTASGHSHKGTHSGGAHLNFASVSQYQWLSVENPIAKFSAFKLAFNEFILEYGFSHFASGSNLIYIF
jgi:hypothetical protein